MCISLNGLNYLNQRDAGPNWGVKIGLNWVRFPYLTRLNIFVSGFIYIINELFELGSFSRFVFLPADPIGGWNEEYLVPAGFILFMRIFRWQHRQIGEFFNWGGAAAPPYQMRCRQDGLFRSGEGRRRQ